MRRVGSWLLAMAAGFGMVALSDFAAAQSAQKTRLITLGTAGGPLPTKNRAQSSNLLIVNGTLYLIDAGDGVLRRIVQSGADFRRLGTIFITHHHSDHMAGLATLLAIQWEFNRKEPTNVYGPPGTTRMVNGAIDYFTVNAEIRTTEGKSTPLSKVFVGHDVAPGTVYQDANVKVIAVENSHFNIPKTNPYFGKHKSFSYRFETPDRVIVFTGDTGPSEAVVALAKGADVLVSEVLNAEEIKQRRIRSGLWQKMPAAEQVAFMQHLTEEHVSPTQVGEMATRAGVKTVILNHLASSGKPDDDFKRYGDEVSKHFSGRVIVAKDLMEY